MVADNEKLSGRVSVGRAAISDAGIVADGVRRLRLRYIGLLVLAILVLTAWLLLLLAAARRGRRVSRCPRCHSDRIRPSWPQPVDKLWGMSSLQPYRCEACLKRFYALKFKQSKKATTLR